MKKIIRITTVPVSLRTLLKGQLRFMSDYFEMIAISSDGDCFEIMLQEQGGIKGYKVGLTREISPLKDIKALINLVKIFRKEKPFIVHTHINKSLHEKNN